MRPVACALATSLGLAIALAAGCDADERVPTDGPSGCGDCDAPIDANDFCRRCDVDEICVQTFNGTCGQIGLACEPRNAACVGNACTPGCMQWQCNDGQDPPFFRCDVGGCPDEVAGALHCYGP